MDEFAASAGGGVRGAHEAGAGGAAKPGRAGAAVEAGERHDRAALGLAGPEVDPSALRGRVARQEAEAAGEEAERRQLIRQVAGLEEERRRLIEQRGRVQAEAERLGIELTRVEGERLRLEQELELARSAPAPWRRLAGWVRRLRGRGGPGG